MNQTEREPKTVGAKRDAVRVPRSVGLVAPNTLGARSGVVIKDETALYRLLPAGSAQGCRSARVLPAGTTLDVPASRCTAGPGPHGRICPGEDRLFTPADALRAAAVDASGPAGVQPAPSGSAAR
ncbi:hypothetical protein [Streptomyces filamentosus]|uniref:hypothetical protein n=1 Tax=Streptomyces filamentosus TaxID=67294 RepID=UPI0033FF96F1